MDNIEFKIALEDIDDHFTEKLNENLNKIREQFHSKHENAPKHFVHNIRRNDDSPLTMSSNGDSDDITLKTVDIYATKLNILDTLDVYFRCQKSMHEMSSKDASFKNNCMFGITISITSSICVFISFLESYQWRTFIVIALNAFVSFLLLLSKYFKLETSADLHFYISRQFELMCENIDVFQPSHNYEITPQKIHTKVRELEKRVVETRDIANINIPSYIQVLYPVSANINMFSFIKKVDVRIAFLNEQLHNINMEINYITKKFANNMKQREQNRLQYLLDNKVKTKVDVKHAENAYAYLEEIFTRELNKAEYCKNNVLQSYFSKMPLFDIDHSRCNPFVDEYISFIIPKKNV